MKKDQKPKQTPTEHPTPNIPLNIKQSITPLYQKHKVYMYII